MATIKDVAAHAGVGLGTVSRVINNRGSVSEEAQQKVWQAVKQLHYIPDARARAMITKRSYTIGVILPDFTNPFFPNLARGIEHEARLQGYTIVMLDTDWQETVEHHAIETVIKQAVDGVILVASSNAALGSHILRQIKRPLVLLDRGVDGLGASQVTVDHYQGARKAMDWARTQGHTHIGFLAGAAHVNSANLRLRGYLDHLGLQHIATDQLEQHPQLPIIRTDFSFEKAFELTPRLLEQHPEVTCIFAANDLSALGALNYLTSHNIRVPAQVAVIGFDDILMSSLYHPSLTTIHQPTYEMGEIGARLLLKHIETPTSQPEQHVLEPALIVRQSC